MVRLEVLGQIRATCRTVLALDRPSHRRLLAILALDAGRPIRTEMLIDRFWRGEPPPTAKAAIQTHVSAVRRILGADAIITEENGYRLSEAAVLVDAPECIELASAAAESVTGGDWSSALHAADTALAMYRGDPFPELIDDEFARPAIVKLDETRLELHETRAGALLGLDRAGEALPELERLVLEHPLRERIWEHLMTARYRMGRYTEALRAYRELSTRLREVGLEPGDQLRRLQERILLRDKKLTPTPNNLPAALNDFIGRDAEIAAATRLLVDHRLVTLIGAGGSGKTRLATQVANELIGHFGNGVWFVDLVAIEDPALIPSQIAQAMRLTPKGDNALHVISEETRDGKTLIVIDNCEHLLEPSAAICEDLLSSSPELVLLATSREPLRARGEVLVEVNGMSTPNTDVDHVGALHFDSIRLLQARAGLADRSFTIDESNAGAAVNICRRLDGLPLAIELAAARSRTLSLEAIERRLDDHLAFLTTGERTAPQRHRTLHATIEWSYRLLDPNERTALDRLSVFRGGFELESAEHVITGDPVAAGDVPRLVANLVDKSLVTAYETNLGPRHRLLESVRQFAALQLDGAPDATSIHSQHQAFFLSLLDNLWQRAAGLGQNELMRTLEAEGDNLQAALDWSIAETDRSASLTLSAALGWRWYLAGHLHNATSLLYAALDVTEHDRDVALIRALLACCDAYSEDIDGAIRNAREAYHRRTHLDTALTRAWVISTLQLGYFMSVKEDPRHMLPLAQEAEEIVAAANDELPAAIIAHQVIADALCWNGHTEQGLRHQHLAIDCAVRSADPTLIDRTYGSSIYNFMLDPVARRSEPSRVTQDWLARIPLGSDSWMSTATDWLPWVYLQAGDFDRADDAADRIRRRTQEGYNRTIYLVIRATIDWMRGNLGEARGAVEQLDERGVNPRWTHVYYPLAAEIAADQGRLDDLHRIAGNYLEMSVHPTGEAAKLGVLGPLIRAEIDAALESGSEAHIVSARSTFSKMRQILDTHPPLLDSWTSVMTHKQNLAFAEAELTRAADPNPDRWADAAELADYAYYRGYARWRQAEASLRTGRAEAGVDDLRQLRTDAAKLGAQLLVTRVQRTTREFGVDLG